MKHTPRFIIYFNASYDDFIPQRFLIDREQITNFSLSLYNFLFPPFSLFFFLSFFSFLAEIVKIRGFVKISCSDLVGRETDSLISLYFSKSSFLWEGGRHEGGREERLSSKLFPIIAYKNAEATSI